MMQARSPKKISAVSRIIRVPGMSASYISEIKRTDVRCGGDGEDGEER
jgi:hypothetical protein